MENTINSNVILEKKLDSYYVNNKDFVAPQEITVTITLNEYRDLVEKNSTREEAIRKAEANKYERDQENSKLREEVAALKTEIYELKKNAETANNKED